MIVRNKFCNISIFLLIILFPCSIITLNYLPERQWLINQYLPTLQGTILFVGINDYTAEYYKYVKTPTTFETLEILPERAKFGSPYKHYIGDFLEFNPGYKYDHICLFGIMGMPQGGETPLVSVYTITSDESITKALEHATSLLKVGGTLQLGPAILAIPKYNTQFWKERFTQFPLNKYSVITSFVAPRNIIWWGKKLID